MLRSVRLTVRVGQEKVSLGPVRINTGEYKVVRICNVKQRFGNSEVGGKVDTVTGRQRLR